MSDLVTDYGPDHRLASASFSPCRTYRYALNRRWDFSGAGLAWVMLNPSTADAMVNDPTIRRCISFAKAWGFGGISVVNLFAVRSPDPKILATHADPIGPDNDAFLRALADFTEVRTFMAAWGSHPAAVQRGAHVVSLLRAVGATVDCLGLTKAGHPRHPLYVPNGTEPVPYGGAT